MSALGAAHPADHDAKLGLSRVSACSGQVGAEEGRRMRPKSGGGTADPARVVDLIAARLELVRRASVTCGGMTCGLEDRLRPQEDDHLDDGLRTACSGYRIS